jgi:CubicO group peptidase (beta-lactamase class C family)
VLPVRYLYKIVLLVVGLALIILIGSSALFSPTYMCRILRHGESDYYDFMIFPERHIAASPTPFYYLASPAGILTVLNVNFNKGGEPLQQPLEEFLSDSDTTALIIVRDDTLVYEGYFNGFERDSINTSFSAVKSIVSLLVGIAIDQGYVTSEKDSVAEYIHELKNSGFEDITIEDLLLMRSLISYREGPVWFGDDAKTYYMPDLRSLALERTRLNPDYNGSFHYNNYHPLLLGIIIERSTGKTVTAFLEEMLWVRIGTEYPASWSLDSVASGFEKMESGLNYRAIDMAKIGSMLLNNGKWESEIIISSNWLARSIYAPVPLDEDDYRGTFLEDSDIGYQYMWYSKANQRGGLDFFAAGKYGQFLYVSPENNVVIVRNGITEGRVDDWPQVLATLAHKVGEMDIE